MLSLRALEEYQLVTYHADAADGAAVRLVDVGWAVRGQAVRVV